MPVFTGNRIFSRRWRRFMGKNEAWLKCFDATKTGDSPPTDWCGPIRCKTRHVHAGHLQTAMLFIADCGARFFVWMRKPGNLLDEESKATHGPRLGAMARSISHTERQFYVFAASKEKKVLPVLNSATHQRHGNGANGVLYVGR